MEETILAGSSGDKGQDYVLWCGDLHSGAVIHSFKHCSASAKGVAISTGPDSANTIIVASQNGKALVNMYNWGRESIANKMPVPEKLSVLTFSHSGLFLAGGSAESGRVYIWECPSGSLISVQEAHYQAISSIIFTQDDALLLSASLDSRVCVWNLTDILTGEGSKFQNQDDGGSGGNTIPPLHIWSDSALAVSDVKLSLSGATDARAYVASQDHSIRIYDCFKGDLLTTFTLPEPVSAIDIDPCERSIYAGLVSGRIHAVQLYRQTHQGMSGIEAVGGQQTIVNIDVKAEEANQFEYHQSKVTCIAVSFDGTLLVSGDQSGEILVWDIPTRQMIRQIKAHIGRSITSLTLPVRRKNNNNNQQQPAAAAADAVRLPQSCTTNHSILRPLQRTKADPSSKDKRISWKFNIPSGYTPLYKTFLASAADDGNPQDELDFIQNQLASLYSTKGHAHLQESLNESQHELQQINNLYESLRKTHQELWEKHVALVNEKTK